MQLFKRFLLSYFPDAMGKDSMNPASMFVSFISAKDFFTIIDRKIIENYKLNQFDLSMDVFEGKLGLGNDKDLMQSKMTDSYFSYLAAANCNGYKFYNIGNTANALSLVSALYINDVFNEGEDDLLLDAIYAFYLLSFLFAARIKVFPGNDEKSDFQWFVDLYFNFFSEVSLQLKHKVSKKRMGEIRISMLNHIDIFFMMFYYGQRVNQLFQLLYENDDRDLSMDFYHWLFGDTLSVTAKNFVSKADEITRSSEFGTIENNILFEVVPADIHLKYLFLGTDVSEVVNCLLKNVYDKKILDKRLSALTKDPSELDFILDYVTDPDNFKKGFFKGMKQYIAHTRLQDKESFEELDEMMSEIGDNMDNFDQMQIPASIKKESKIMEQFLNFYVSYMGGLSISRADTFFLRFFKPRLTPELMKYFNIHLKNQQSIDFYGKMHIFYAKNVSSYQFVAKKIRSGKEKFYVPAMIKMDPIKSTEFLIKSFDEIALTTLLQDINPQIEKLYVKNRALLNWFQSEYSKKISSIIQQKNTDIVGSYYNSLFSHFALGKDIIQILQNAYTEQDIVRLKNSLYSFDVQIFQEVLSILPWKKMQKIYNDTVVLHILALLRETLFGFLVYYQYLELVQESDKGNLNLNLELLKKIYITQLINLDETLYKDFVKLIDNLLEQFKSPISLFVELDDNREFFSILKDNRMEFIGNIDEKYKTENGCAISLEDLLRLRGTFKNITYYNKRYLIPN